MAQAGSTSFPELENAEGTGLPWKELLAKLGADRQTARAIWVMADTCRVAAPLSRSRTDRVR